MNAIEKMKAERAEKIAKVIADNPGVPIMCLAPSTPSDYDTYYHDACSASVDWILKPFEVEKTCGHTFGLNGERYYSDETDAMEDVAEWLFEGWWDEAMLHGMKGGNRSDWTVSNDDILTEFCGETDAYSMYDLSENVAWKIVEDLPWRKYIIIDCY